MYNYCMNLYINKDDLTVEMKKKEPIFLQQCNEFTHANVQVVFIELIKLLFFSVLVRQSTEN